MRNGSRGLGDTVIRGMAKVGLVWAVAVLGALFMVMGAQGHRSDGGYSLAAAGADAHRSFAVSPDASPHMAGLVLALLILAAGATVLGVGATRASDSEVAPPVAAPHDPAADLPLALGLGLTA